MNYIFSKRWAPTSLWPASGRTVCSAPRTGTRSLACSKRRAAVFFYKMYDFDLYPIRICDYRIPAVLTSVAEPVLFWPAPAPGTFFTGSGSFSYKNRLKSSKKVFCLHIFTPAPTKKYRLRPAPAPQHWYWLMPSEHIYRTKCRKLFCQKLMILLKLIVYKIRTKIKKIYS